MCLVTHAPPGCWIDVTDIQARRPEILTCPKNSNPAVYQEDETTGYSEAIRAFRRKLVLERLRCHGGPAAEAAASLQISEPTFYRNWAEARRAP